MLTALVPPLPALQVPAPPALEARCGYGAPRSPRSTRLGDLQRSPLPGLTSVRLDPLVGRASSTFAENQRQKFPKFMTV